MFKFLLILLQYVLLKFWGYFFFYITASFIYVEQTEITLSQVK